MPDRLIIIGGAILAVIILVLFSCDAIEKRRTQAAESRLERAQGKAAHESARDAIKAQQGAAERERASDDLTRTNAEEIRNAEGSADPVHAGVRDAGLRGLCRRAAYSDSERCRLLRAGSGLGETR